MKSSIAGINFNSIPHLSTQRCFSCFDLPHQQLQLKQVHQQMKDDAYLIVATCFSFRLNQSHRTETVECSHSRIPGNEGCRGSEISSHCPGERVFAANPRDPHGLMPGAPYSATRAGRTHGSSTHAAIRPPRPRANSR